MQFRDKCLKALIFLNRISETVAQSMVVLRCTGKFSIRVLLSLLVGCLDGDGSRSEATAIGPLVKLLGRGCKICMLILGNWLSLKDKHFCSNQIGLSGKVFLCLFIKVDVQFQS